MINSIQGMGGMRPMGGMQAPRPLSDEQKATVKDLLSEYDPETVTAADAKVLFQSFKDAGIKGPGLREAVQEAGFDADEMFSLAHDGQKPPMGGPASQGSQKIDTSTLQTLQSILEQYDLSNLTADAEKEMMNQLSSAGLLRTGSVLDFQA